MTPGGALKDLVRKEVGIGGEDGKDKIDASRLRDAGQAREKGIQTMMSRYRGRGFYDPLSEMNRLFDQMFGGVAGEQGKSRGHGTPGGPRRST